MHYIQKALNDLFYLGLIYSYHLNEHTQTVQIYNTLKRTIAILVSILNRPFTRLPFSPEVTHEVHADSTDIALRVCVVLQTGRVGVSWLSPYNCK